MTEEEKKPAAESQIFCPLHDRAALCDARCALAIDTIDGQDYACAAEVIAAGVAQINEKLEAIACAIADQLPDPETRAKKAALLDIQLEIAKASFDAMKSQLAGARMVIKPR